jgi:hypothetical protein
MIFRVRAIPFSRDSYFYPKESIGLPNGADISMHSSLQEALKAGLKSCINHNKIQTTPKSGIN